MVHNYDILKQLFSGADNAAAVFLLALANKRSSIKAKRVEGLVVAEKFLTSCDVTVSYQLVVNFTILLVPHKRVGGARMVLKAVEAIKLALTISNVDRVNQVVEPYSLAIVFQADSVVVRDNQ